MNYLGVLVVALLAASCATPQEPPVDYTGHKVITVHPANDEQLQFVKELGDKYQVDMWTEPIFPDVPLMIRLHPEIVEEIEGKLKEANIPYDTAIPDLQRAIEAERIANAPVPLADKRVSHSLQSDRYLRLSEIWHYLDNVASKHPEIVTLVNIGTSYENKPIKCAKIGSDDSKPAILIECGIHAREWVSVSSCLYLIDQLSSKYDTDPNIKAHQWYIIPSSNPDGYVFSWEKNRLWRKTRSRSKFTTKPYCMGADANRNFDIHHCGIGTSQNPCDDIYCGDAPFSEKETQALRDITLSLRNRLKAYFSVHAYSQLWMTPWGYTEDLPPDYKNLERICQAGIDAIKNLHGTVFRCGSISRIIYPASGSSIDWTYDKVGIKNSFALELRDKGTHGFMLPNHFILPTCEETFDGIMAAINAI